MCLIVGCCPQSHWEHYYMLRAFYSPAKTWTFLNSETYPALHILYKGLWTWTTLFNLSSQMFTNSDNTENVTGRGGSCPTSTACLLDAQVAQQPFRDLWTWGLPRRSVRYPACSREQEIKFQGWNLQIYWYIGTFLKWHTTFCSCGSIVIINRNRFRTQPFCIPHAGKTKQKKSE